MLIAVLDADVLFPMILRDTLLRLGGVCGAEAPGRAVNGVAIPGFDPSDAA